MQRRSIVTLGAVVGVLTGCPGDSGEIETDGTGSSGAASTTLSSTSTTADPGVTGTTDATGTTSGTTAEETSGSTGEPMETCADTTLRTAANCAGIEIGTSADDNAVLADPAHAQIMAEEFHSITPGNALKWGPLAPAPDSWDFSDGQAFIDFADANNQTIKGHALLWHRQQPAWAEGLGPADFEQAVIEHIGATLAEYDGSIDSWDVVNEAFETDGSYRDSNYLQRLGTDYIASAFTWADEAAPNVRLIYNDFGIAAINPKSDAVYAMAQDLLERGVRIDEVGLQMHVRADQVPSPAGVRANVERLAALGLTVNVSELDVRIAPLGLDQATAFEAQRIVTHQMMWSCLQSTACRSITFWGFTDAHSWIDGEFGPDDPLLFDESYAKKPMYEGALSALLGQDLTRGADLTQNGDFEANTDAWAGRSATIGATQAEAAVGSQSVLVSGRTDTWNGITQEIDATLAQGNAYEISAQVRLASPANVDEIRLVARTVSDNGYTVLDTRPVDDAQWVQLSGLYVRGANSATTGLQLVVDGPAATVSFYVDDVHIRQLQ